MPEETTLSQPRRKSRVVAFAVLIFVVIAAAVIYGLFGTSRLDRQLADLRSRGLPTNGQELNAWYAVPSDVRDTTDLWIAATRAIDTSKINKKAVGVPLFAEGLPPIPPPDEEWAELEISRAFLKDLDQEIQLIRDAADAGGMARYPVDFTQGYKATLTDPQQLRTLAMLSSLSGHVNAHDGQTLGVLKDLKSIFAASDSIRGVPMLVPQLIRIAIHAMGCKLTAEMLPHCKWTDADLQNLQIATGRADFRLEMRNAFHGELAMLLNDIDGYPYPQSMFRGANKSKAIELLAGGTEGLETSWQEAIIRQQKVNKELKAMSSGLFTLVIYKSLIRNLPVIHRCINAGIKAEAQQNGCIAVIAAHRYRLKHGTLPHTLTDLQDFIPNEDPSKSFRLVDPFDGQPLRFKISDDSVIIYSIGENKVDDRGDVENKNPEDGDLGYLISQ